MSIFTITKAHVKCPVLFCGAVNILVKVRQYILYGTGIEIPEYKLRGFSAMFSNLATVWFITFAAVMVLAWG